MNKLYFITVFIVSTLSSPISAQETSGDVSAPPASANTQSINAESYFQQGVAAKAIQQYQLAAKVFQLVLTVNPNHFRARRALVDTLIQLEKYEAAEFHLRKLIHADPNPNVQNTYFAVLDTIIKNRPLRYGASFAILPSTNINNGTKNFYFDSNIGQFIIDESGRESSGVGLHMGATGAYRWSLGHGRLLEFSGSLSGAWYDVESLRRIDGKLSATYQLDTADDQWSVGPYYRRSWYFPTASETRSNNQAVGVALSYSRQISTVDTVGYKIIAEDQTYFEKPHLSGSFQSATFNLEHRASADMLYSLNIGVQAHEPEARHLAYQGVSVSAGVQKSWGNSLRTGVTLGAGVREYDANYTALDFPRDDQYYSVGLSLQNNNIKIFDTVPRMNCTYKRNLSNVAFYDYHTTSCQIMLNKVF